jgi:hypothetical protein
VTVDAGNTPGSAPHAISSPGGTGSSNQSRWITLRHLHLRGGTDSTIFFDYYHEDIVLSDLEMDGFEAFRDRHGGGVSNAAIRIDWADRVTIEDVRMTGPPGGADGCAIHFYVRDGAVRRCEASDFLGNFVLVSSAEDDVFEYNVLRRMGCDHDDGCFQGYNTPRMVVRYNTILETSPLKDYMGVVAVRRTNAGTREPSVEVSHNTFVADPDANPALRSNAVVIHGSQDGSDIGPVSIHDNVFVGYGNSDLTGSGAVVVLACPTSLEIDHDLFFDDARNVDDTASCAGPFEASGVFADPLLDADGFPGAGSPACGAGEGGSDIGARACP